MKNIGLVLFVLVASSAAAQSAKITAAEAKDHVGQKATVCGTVASSHYAEKTKGSPTFLNLDEAYPKQIFTIVIWGSERPKFGKPETAYQNTKVCVTGKITEFKGKPEINATDPTQIVAVQK